MVTTARTQELPRSPNLSNQIERGGLVRNGAQGEVVTEAQRLLQAHGFSVGPKGVDGQFGNDTKSAVERFQASRGIQQDGIIGPDTLRELRTPTTGVDARRGVDRGVQPQQQDRVPGMSGADFERRSRVEQQQRRETPPTRPGEVTLAPRNMSERERWDHYANIVRANGGQVNPDGKPTVLGIRGMDINGNRHESTNSRRYDDTFVVLTADHRVLELKGGTHAGQTTSSLVDHVGRINAGNYMASPNGSHNGAASFHVKTLSGSGNIPGVRDRNDDGRYSQDEINRSGQRGDTLSAILFHQGFENSPKSIGCQTMSPSDYRRFLDRVGSRGFSFSLVSS